MKYPKSRFVKPDTPVTQGAHGFGKYVLPSLKYHNPSLEIDVRTYPKSPALLKLYFQCQDQEKLRNIAQPGKGTPTADISLPHVDQTAPPSFSDRKARRPSAADDEIIPRQLPANSPLPQPLYQRTVTLALRERKMHEILRWFQKRTNSQRIGTTPEDARLAKEFEEAEIERDLARERSKIQQAAIDREKAVLEQAKRIAERNANEAAAQAAS